MKKNEVRRPRWMAGATKAGWTLALLMTTGVAWAQTEAAPRPPSRDLVTNIVNTLVFGIIGIILAAIGFKVFDLIIKHDIEKEIFDNKNMAAALLSGLMLLGVCIIIAATIASP